MIRTVISLHEDDKAWLDHIAQIEGITMTEVVRRAVKLLRNSQSPTSESQLMLLKQTSGIWSKEDGLAYQEQLRQEWQK